MKIELTQELAIDLVKGTSPAYKLFEELEISKRSTDSFGDYNDQYGRFYWYDSRLKRLSVEQLYNLYERCKNSWK